MPGPQKVNCPRCRKWLCNRSPSGFVAGEFFCRSCKLEMVLEYTTLSECTLVIVPPEVPATLGQAVTQRLHDGRGLIPWDVYKLII